MTGQSLYEVLSAPQRLTAVAMTQLLDAPSDLALDRLAVLSARVLKAPWAFITVVDETRSYWSSAVQQDGAPLTQRQSSVEESFCQYVIDDCAPLLVDDTLLEPRTAHNPSVLSMGVRAWAGYPLRSPGGEVLGSFCVVDTVPRTWTSEDAEVLAALSEAAGAQIATMMAAREVAEQRERLRTLGDATGLLLSDLDPLRLLRQLCELAVPQLAAWCTAWLPRGRSLEAAAGVGPGGTDVLWPSVDLDGQSLSARAFRLRLPQLLDDLTGHLVRSDPDAPITARSIEIDGGAAYSIPLIAADEVLGVLTLVRRRSDPPFTDAEREFAQQLAMRAAGVLRIAQTLDEQRTSSEVLQRSMLPELPSLPGLDCYALYRPAGGMHVGGDWYDVLELSAGRFAVTIGDVMGRGVQAAAVMGQLRTAQRMLARLGIAPAKLLSHLEQVLADLEGEHIVTCFYGLLDTAEQTLTWANAGHLMPVRLSPAGTVTTLSGPMAAPLGCGAQLVPEVLTALESNEVLCLFTDGLAEDRRRDIDQGLEALSASLSGHHGNDLELIAKDLVRDVAGTEEDDVAVLLLRVLASCRVDEGRTRTASLPLAGDTEAVGHSRHWAGGVLRSWGHAAQLVDDVTAILAELVANAIVHGLPPVVVHLRDRPECVFLEVEDAGGLEPRPRYSGAQDESGRGLRIVGALASRWGTRVTLTGKVVWAEVPRPA